MATRRSAPKSTSTRAVLYLRVSTAQQAADGVSIEDQRARLTDYAKAKGLTVVKVVTDEGESAGKPLERRTGGRQVLRLLEQKKADAVLVTKLDRAFRSTKDALETIDSWDRAGVALHVLDLGGLAVDTSSATGRVFITMISAFGEFERNLAAERTTAALAHKARSGDMRLGADAPYGWRYEGNALAEVEAEQKVIRLVRELREAGVSFRKVCAALTAGKHFNRAGGEFVPVQLERMLRGSTRQWHAEQA